MNDRNAPWRVFASNGWGSAIAEAMLTLAGIAYERDLVDPSVPGPDRDRLLAANPLGQLPTVVLPDGTVLTESAAITLRAAEIAPHAGLAPSADDPARTAFLRWLVFLVAAIYPTFTYGDDPKRWVTTSPDELRASTNAHRVALWQQMDRAAVGPWFLGERFSALDVYIAVMTRWRPGRAALAELCPKLATIATAVDANPALAPVLRQNFES
ncbi:Hypothetical protein A7982_02012 [Minicystis rosea]|nr:Hypothetical protein A7982_02012 [Minicystis rosea]